MKFCPNCGKNIEKGQKFCPECGEKITQNVEEKKIDKNDVEKNKDINHHLHS